MVAVIWRYYVRQHDATDAAAAQQLAAIAEVKAIQIANWRAERLGDGRTLCSAAMAGVAQKVLSGSETESDRTGLLDHLGRLQHAFLYAGAALVDRQGNIRIQSSPLQASTARLRDLADAAAQADDAALTDLYLDENTGHPMMALTAPVRGRGAFILEIDPARFLFPFVTSWPVLSDSAETVLFRREGEDLLYLNGFRHAVKAPLVFRRSLREFGLPPETLLESRSPFHTFDYRGVPTMDVVRRISDSPWYLAAKINVAEVEAPVERLAWHMALIVVLICATVIAAVGFILKGQQVRIHEQQQTVLRAVADDTPAYLWMWSSNPERYFSNKPLSRFLGTDQERWEAEWAVIHPQDRERARAAFLEASAAHRESIQEFRLRRHDGQYRWVTSLAAPRFSPKGDFLGYAGSIIDITERRQAEEQLRQAYAALAGELAERTRHEQAIQSLSARLINAQEAERARVARELHDDLSQQIAALSIAMGNLRRMGNAKNSDAQEQYGRFQQKLIEAADSVRRISHQLHPAVLEGSGLVSALQAYCDEFTALTGIRVGFRVEMALREVPPGLGLGLYRIAQEALQNVAKHAHVNDAEVVLEDRDGMLCLTISDHGTGMDLMAAPAGLGLISIKERARLLDGFVTIESAPDQGTTITVRVSHPMPASVTATA